jgi:hypothetical protein
MAGTIAAALNANPDTRKTVAAGFIFNMKQTPEAANAANARYRVLNPISLFSTECSSKKYSQYPC